MKLRMPGSRHRKLLAGFALTLVCTAITWHFFGTQSPVFYIWALAAVVAIAVIGMEINSLKLERILSESQEKLKEAQWRAEALQRMLTVTGETIVRAQQQEINRTHNHAIEMAAKLCEARTSDDTLSKAVRGLRVKSRRKKDQSGDPQVGNTHMPTIEQ